MRDDIEILNSNINLNSLDPHSIVKAFTKGDRWACYDMDETEPDTELSRSIEDNLF